MGGGGGGDGGTPANEPLQLMTGAKRGSAFPLSSNGALADNSKYAVPFAFGSTNSNTSTDRPSPDIRMASEECPTRCSGMNTSPKSTEIFTSGTYRAMCMTISNILPLA